MRGPTSTTAYPGVTPRHLLPPILLAALFATPGPARAQLGAALPLGDAADAGSIASPPDTRGAYRRLCADAHQALNDGLLATAVAERDADWRAAEAAARAALAVDADDVEAHYLLGVALGMQAEFEPSSRRQLALGRESYAEARRALELDPDDAGAHHLMGRLNAAAMRLPAFTRFIAGRVLGSDLMRDASWQDAEAELRRAAALEPGALVHRLELGKVLKDEKRDDAARAEFEWVLAQPASSDLDALFQREARAEIEKLR